MRLTAFVAKDRDLYVAQCVEVDVASQGATIEAALENLKEALELYFENSAPAVAPVAPIIAPIDVHVPGF